jgi:hypothetical protein
MGLCGVAWDDSCSKRAVVHHLQRSIFWRDHCKPHRHFCKLQNVNCNVCCVVRYTSTDDEAQRKPKALSLHSVTFSTMPRSSTRECWLRASYGLARSTAQRQRSKLRRPQQPQMPNKTENTLTLLSLADVHASRTSGSASWSLARAVSMALSAAVDGPAGGGPFLLGTSTAAIFCPAPILKTRKNTRFCQKSKSQVLEIFGRKKKERRRPPLHTWTCRHERPRSAGSTTSLRPFADKSDSGITTLAVNCCALLSRITIVGVCTAEKGINIQHQSL